MNNNFEIGDTVQIIGHQKNIEYMALKVGEITKIKAKDCVPHWYILENDKYDLSWHADWLSLYSEPIDINDAEIEKLFGEE